MNTQALQDVLINHFITAIDATDAYNRYAMWTDCLAVMGLSQDDIINLHETAVAANQEQLAEFFDMMQTFVESCTPQTHH